MREATRRAPLPPSGYSPQRSLRSLGGETGFCFSPQEARRADVGGSAGGAGRGAHSPLTTHHYS